MGQTHNFTKALSAASATNISLSQTPGSGAIIINGAASAGAGAILRLGAITAGSGYVNGTYFSVPLTGGSGSNAVATITVSGGAVVAAVIGANGGTQFQPTTGTGYLTSDSLGASNANLGGSGSGFAIGVAAVTTAIATLDTQRRVIITSGGADTGVNFTVTGTNDAGYTITDTFAGASGGAAQSNLDFKTVSSITASSAPASTITAGTNGVGSAPWITMNCRAQMSNLSLSGIVAAGQTVNWTWQYTYDDPNNLPSGINFPRSFNHVTLVNQAGTLDGVINDPVTAVRLLVNSGTGTVTGQWLQAGPTS